jgi:hypothetical protein
MDKAIGAHQAVTFVGKRKNPVLTLVEDGRAIQTTPNILPLPVEHESIKDCMDKGIRAGVSCKTDRTAGA